jgi:hypothetical protein
MRRRNDISKFLTLVALVCVPAAAHAQVAPDKPLHLAHVEGYVTNTAGKPVPNAEVTLDQDGTVAARTHTDQRGAFHFDHVLGHYWLRVARTENAPAAREIAVGDLIESYVERKKLYVVVGPGACADACSSVYTSKHEFEKAIKDKNRH